MGIFDKLLKKDTESKAEASEKPQEESFVYGVEDVFNLNDSDDVVVVGNNLHFPREDDGYEYQTSQR